MTAAAGDALSHVLIAAILERQFQAYLSPQITHLLRTKWTLRRFADLDICSCAGCMGVMSHQQERQGFPSHSISRITCSNLVEADEDLARQYFQVMDSL